MTDLERLADHFHAQAKATRGTTEGDLWAALAGEVDAYLGRADGPGHVEPSLLEVP